MTMVAATGSAGVWADGSAAAATEGSLRARAGVIEEQLASESATLYANSTSYLAARSAYSRSIAAEGRTQTRIQSIERTVKVQRSVVRAAALVAYVNAGKVSALGLYLDGSPNDLATGATYVRAASEHIASSIALLTGSELTLSSNLKVERFEVTSAAHSLALTSAARQSALAAVGAERASLSSVNGALATLVQEEEIARQRAAAEAAARAAAAAAASSAASPVTSSGPPAILSIGSTAVTTAVPTSLAASFAAIRRCESSGNYALNTGNGYYGAYQFSAATWSRLGGAGLASSASAAAQDAAAYKLYQSSGWSAWPECAAISGL
jgi:hypothetical protein